MAKYNWTAIRLDYEVGRMSFDDLREKYGAAKSTLHRRAKSEGWEKGAIAQKAAAAAKEIANTTTIGDITLSAVEITERHKQEIFQTRELLGDLSQHIRDALDDKKKKEVVTKDGRTQVRYSLNDLTSAGIQFVKILDSLQIMERRSYGLDIDKPTDDDKTVEFVFE